MSTTGMTVQKKTKFLMIVAVVDTRRRRGISVAAAKK